VSYRFRFNELTKEYFLRKEGLSSIYFPNKIGYMDTTNINISDNIILAKENVYAKNSFEMGTEPRCTRNTLFLNIILEGNIELYDHLSNSSTKHLKNNISIAIKKDLKKTFIMNQNTQVKCMGITMTNSFLEKTLFPNLKDKIRMKIEKNYENNIESLFKFSLASSKTLSLAKEIYNSPFIGTLNDLYLQSRVYEIIHDEFLSIINAENKPKQNRVILSQDDIEALHRAKELILKNKRHFSLDELSKKVALNQTKLKHGFKQLFHTTPGNIMLEARMYEAKRLLEESEYNVTEIAHLTGYKYVPNFTNAFIKFFNKMPSDLMKKRKYYY